MNIDEAISILRISANPWNLPALLAWAAVFASKGPEDSAIVATILSALLSKEATP